MLVDLIRIIVPIKYRRTWGLWIMTQAAKTKWLLYPWMLVLCGRIPKGLTLRPNGEFQIHHEGVSIQCPRDGIFTAWEVLQDKIYEKVHCPSMNQTVVDVGAYVGMFAVRAATLVGIRGTVVAIEPSSRNLKYLRRNTMLIPNIVIAPVAAGAITGKGKLSISGASPCHTLLPERNNETEDVIIDTLDNILASRGIEKVDFIKVDVEGYEIEVLKGATETLRHKGLKLAVAAYHELANGEPEMWYVAGILRRAGFKIRYQKGYIYAEN